MEDRKLSTCKELIFLGCTALDHLTTYTQGIILRGKYEHLITQKSHGVGWEEIF